MEERHISQHVQTLVDRFEYVGEAGFKIEDELNHLANPITREPLDDDSRAKIEKGFLDKIRYRKSFDEAGSRLVPVSVVSAREHEEWYGDWLAENNDAGKSYYWKRLADFLSGELTTKYGPQKAGEVVRAIDEATFAIMKKLAEPARHEFSYKGLVVGYVQSGKTANFTALIAKAADAGYKFIIVLAGIHNVLRRQTQVRLDRELTGIKDIETSENYIPRPGAAKDWTRLTTAHNDFTTKNLGMFSSYCGQETPILAVVKKHVGVLNNLIEYLSRSTPEERAKMPLLIIDDEADQASIDTNANNDTDPSRTNAKIRELLSLFSRKTYIGYTATPFANVLIDMAVEHVELEDDLYPRNFIVSLPKPDGYFGTSLIFQGNLSEKFVIETADDANELIRRNDITDNLAEAVEQFILSCAVRNLRGDRAKPMSMLVHVSHRINDMGIVNGIIADYIDLLKDRYRSRQQHQLLKQELEAIWNEFAADCAGVNEELHLDNAIPNFENIWNELQNVFPVLKIVELNSASEDNLDYTVGGEIKVIAIGGNQLSRGLTLEGLMISYYLRATRQYDTLLQMGRWFGYRHGYEDLTRIYTTEQIWGFFEHLALVEEELRSEIYRYEEENLTPAQMALAIRDHRNLTVTARNKMGAASMKQSSYSDSLNQTIWLPLDEPDVLKANLRLGESFVKRINDDCGFTYERSSGAHVATALIDGELILRDFLNRYTFVDRDRTGGPGLDAESLLAYIFRRQNDQTPELTRWKVAVVSNVKPKAANTPVDFGGVSINRIQRSRKYTERGYNIGVLTEPDHLNIGENNGVRELPLLLLYVIWSGSEAATFRENPLFDQRIDLYRFIDSEKVDVLGIAVALPRSRFEPNSYIGQ